MRFALLGAHPDGVDMATALVDSGRHEVPVCTTALDEATLRRLGNPVQVSDMEEILANPAIEAVIVAGAAAVRPLQLRRALQSERHVLCVCPADDSPDLGYEAAMLQRDTGYVLLPLLPEMTHPAFARLAEFIDQPVGNALRGVPGGDGTPRRAFPTEAPSLRGVPSPVGVFRLLQFERASTGEILDNAHEAGLSPALPGWDVLRRLGGELIEVSSFTDGEGLAAGLPVLLAGRFEKGGLFQVTLLPSQPCAWWRLVVVGTAGKAELTFPQGWEGPAFLEWLDETGQKEEYQQRWDPWPVLVEAFEASLRKEPAALSWQDAVRALELDDAARRSVERRRVNLMDYQEASEEVGFKGTMTLVGCGLLWAVLLLLIASVWVPWMGWLILPLLVVFSGMQLLRYMIPPAPSSGEKKETE
jgi:predicted dehydrogenase